MFLHGCGLRTTTSPDGAEEATALPRCDGAAGPTRCREMEKASREPRCQPDFVSSAYVLPTCWICLVLFSRFWFDSSWALPFCLWRLGATLRIFTLRQEGPVKENKLNIAGSRAYIVMISAKFDAPHLQYFWSVTKVWLKVTVYSM